MTLALDQNIDNQLLTKFQPKIIENEEEYEQARHLLINLIVNRIDYQKKPRWLN